jgi:hypothetical protein
MAQGKKAFGFCDRTGHRYPLKDLVPQYVSGKPSGLLVGRDMLDIDHEQWKLGELKVTEDISLKNPRPDTSEIESRELWAFDPVGGGQTEFGSRTVGLGIEAAVGKVTVS